MVPVVVKTLVMSAPPAPSVIILQPESEEEDAASVRVVPIWVGCNEATQMGIALEQVKFSRPMTHDLFLDALTNLDARVDHVFIHSVRGATFFAALTLRQQGRLIELDARPSDALALAVRENAPIFMDETVFEENSFPYRMRTKKAVETGEKEMAEFKQFLAGITPDDFR